MSEGVLEECFGWQEQKMWNFCNRYWWFLYMAQSARLG